MTRPFYLAPGESGAERLRLERQIDESLHRPRLQKTQHRICPITADCIDCGRSVTWIALNEYEACFEVTR